jgi:hypothetical protein
MPQRQLDIDLFRGVLRRLKYASGRSSYPFISGDTYASLCDYQFNQETSLVELKKNSKPIKLFLPAHFKDQFLSKLNKDETDFSGDTLVIHNYDNIPSNAEMRLISSRFKDVYCVNWLGDKHVATPIPIGLENWSLLRNGVPSDFLRLIDRGLIPTSKRRIKILSGFSIETNSIERSKAIKFAQSNRDVFHLPAFISPKKYRELVSNSAFVLSPPGNGADCHRTWEAIYLGAIPIVLKKYWPFGELDLPVLAVEEWTDVPKAIEAQGEWGSSTVEELMRAFLTFQ